MQKELKFAVAHNVIEHNYLPLQFNRDAVSIWLKIQRVVERGDFTLGKELKLFEEAWARYVGVNHAIGVNSGTDALILVLKALGIKGEVLVPAFSFVASAATVALAGAQIRFVDVGDDFNIDINRLEGKITHHTEAIMPVHWAGRPCAMTDIRKIAKDHSLVVLEDACHAIGATHKQQQCGSFGNAAAFSLHPLKNVNAWGDGGVITTNNDQLAEKLRSLRNHGLSDRNTCQHWAHNSRLDTIQAVVAHYVLDKIDFIIRRRRENAEVLDKLLTGIQGVRTPEPHPGMTYYLYSLRVRERNNLLTFLNAHGVDAKAHYPIALHLQPAAAKLQHKRGDFPGAELACDETLSLPVHEFVQPADLERMAALIHQFYDSLDRA